MIQTAKLQGIIVENNMTQRDVALKLGMNPQTFYRKMRKGIFDSDEIYQMINMLHIEDPAAIFFANAGA